MPAMKVLILKRDKIGDMLLMTPMLAHLRRAIPQAEIHLLANDYNAWVIQDDPNIDKLWIYPRLKSGDQVRPFAVIKQLVQLMSLQRERFDFAIAGGGVVSPRAIKRILKLGARRTVAFCEGIDLCARLTDPIPFPKGVHEVDLNIRLLEPLGIAPPQTPDLPVYRLPEQWAHQARDWLAQEGLQPGGYVVLGLNARRAKRKPTEAQIFRWARHFKQAWGLDTVFAWMPGPADSKFYPGDDELVRPILDKKPDDMHPFAYSQSVMPLLGIVWQAAMSIFPDGGLAHLAAASPGGALALFAETTVSPHPSQWGPRGRNAAYLEADKSVEELPDEKVFAVVERLIAGSAISANTGRG